jgi:hypothetical protein
VLDAAEGSADTSVGPSDEGGVDSSDSSDASDARDVTGDDSSDSATGEAAAVDSGATDAAGDVVAPLWVGQDIGPVTAPGSWCAGGGCIPAEPAGTYMVSGSGADIGLCNGMSCGNGNTDEFYYLYQAVTGDATLTAHVTSIAMVTDWSKAFLAMRDGLADDAAFVSLAVPATPSYGYYWFYRLTPSGALAFPNPAMPGGTPIWFRIVRRGDVFTGLYSADGVIWNQLAQTTIAMSATLHIGIAVVSHMNGTLTTGLFDNVSLTTP